MISLLLQLAGVGNVRPGCAGTGGRPSKPALSFTLTVASYSKVLPVAGK